MKRLPSLLAFALLAAACQKEAATSPVDASPSPAGGAGGGGPQDGAPGGTVPGDAAPGGTVPPEAGSTGGGWGEEISEACGVERWAGHDLPPTSFVCRRPEGSDAPFRCDCAGETTVVAGGDCAASLAAACDVDPSLPADYCLEEPGLCTLDTAAAGPAWDCVCDDGATVGGVPGACHVAAFNACAAPCEDADGACVPAPGPGGEPAYDCTCRYHRITRRGVACHEALGSACRPACGVGGGECFVNAELDGLLCRCPNDETLVAVSYASVGHDDCATILSAACGVSTDPPETCEQVGDDATVSCRIWAESWACFCETNATELAGSNEGLSCDALMRAACPAAFD